MVVHFFSTNGEPKHIIVGLFETNDKNGVAMA
jgi:hypothetical protein